MTAFSLGARLHFGANSGLALSLPQSRCFNPFSPRQLPPQREPRRLPPQATEFSKVRTAVKPAFGGLHSSVTVPHSGVSRLPCIAERFWQTLAENPMRRHATIKMCRDPRHTFIFHVPEGRASYAEGVLHVPQARFICGTQHRTAPPSQGEGKGGSARSAEVTAEH